MNEFRFTLYVAGENSRSQQAIANLRRLCEEELRNAACDFTVVDVLANPQAAEAGRILATPTLVRESPRPLRRNTGDLSDFKRVLLGLALPAQRQGTPSAEQPTT